jgi:hypothetical protein
MHSYNRRIKNQAISLPQSVCKIHIVFIRQKAFQKQSPPLRLDQCELVPIHNCRISHKNVPNRRNQLCECCPCPRSGHRIFADQDFIYVIGGYNQIMSNDKT